MIDEGRISNLQSRSGASARKILVLGGKGFIGRHAVKHLLAAGADVTIGTRRLSRDSQMPARQMQLQLHLALSKSDWLVPARNFDVILNCVGILRQRWGETYKAVHHHAPQAIAQACADHATRFVHVSALGLSAAAKSRFLTSKFYGEKAIQVSGADWLLARISLLDGEGGYGAAWLRGVAKSPLFIVPSSAKGKIAALTAEDAGRALARLCLAPSESLNVKQSRIFELGGEHSFEFEQYIRGLRTRYASSPAACIRLPGWLARLGAHVCDVLHFSPFSFGHWELLCRNNVPTPNRLPELLGEPPERVIQTK
ncbi:MAG: NAD(P)H-binding protein [Pseudomonadota bacterium]